MEKTLKEVEKQLQSLLDTYKISKKLTVSKIKQRIFNDEGDSAMDASNRFQKWWIQYFSRVKDIDELNDVLQVFVDAWNSFPHQRLNGKSPNEMVKEALQKNPKLRNEHNQKMPDMIIGGRKIPWDEYWLMIKEMEKLQIPFKKWVKEDVLPAYEKFLEASLRKTALKKHMEVANIFFDRVMHVGFIEMDLIRKDFVQKEFPHWWQTHVMMSNLSEKEVLVSLEKLFCFISSEWGKNIKKFGF